MIVAHSLTRARYRGTTPVIHLRLKANCRLNWQLRYYKGLCVVFVNHKDEQPSMNTITNGVNERYFSGHFVPSKCDCYGNSEARLSRYVRNYQTRPSSKPNRTTRSRVTDSRAQAKRRTTLGAQGDHHPSRCTGVQHKSHQRRAVYPCQHRWPVDSAQTASPQGRPRGLV